MPKVFFKGLQKDKNVVQVCKTNDIQKTLEGVVDVVLESRRRVGKSKR